MLSVESPAKINWTLRVTGKRPDGYHDLETVFQTISLHDTLVFEESPRLVVTCDDPAVPVDERNLVTRAARALGADRIAIHIGKRIPAGGGLGGGSSNAATTLVTLSTLLGITVPLEPIALSLGSDVPFFLQGGTAYATGRGERLTPIEAPSGIPLLLVLPDVRVSTATAFGNLRRFSPPLGIERQRALAAQIPLATSDWINDFEESVFAELPELARIRERLVASGATWARMSGSGSTMAGAFRSEADRDRAAGMFPELRVETATTRAAARN